MTKWSSIPTFEIENWKKHTHQNIEYIKKNINTGTATHTYSVNHRLLIATPAFRYQSTLIIY